MTINKIKLELKILVIISIHYSVCEGEYIILSIVCLSNNSADLF